MKSLLAKTIIGLTFAFGLLVFARDGDQTLPSVVSPTEFDVAQVVSEGRLRIVPTDNRDRDKPLFKVSLASVVKLPNGAKLVRVEWMASHQCWACVVAHPSFLRSSPTVPVVVMTSILKVVE